MKNITVALVAVGIVIIGGFYYQNSQVELPSYVREVTEVIPEEVVEEDSIEKARKELERINAELDAEEQTLLNEIKEREDRIEKIRETRMSFQ